MSPTDDGELKPGAPEMLLKRKEMSLVRHAFTAPLDRAGSRASAHQSDELLAADNRSEFTALNENAALKKHVTQYLGNREPPLGELLDDPIAHLVMARDGLSPTEIRAYFEEVRRRPPTLPPENAAMMRISPGSDLSAASLAAAHELAERLTAISNYLAAALRLSDIEPPSLPVRSDQKEILEKAAAQADLTSAIMTELRRLLAAGASTPESTCSGVQE